MSRRGISRRSAAAGGVAMLVLAAAAAGQAKAEELDGELMALCREFTDLNAEFDRLGLMEADLPSGTPEQQILDAQARAIVARIHVLRDEISEIPAKTPEGIIAKAKIAYADMVEETHWPLDNTTWIALSVLEDVLGRAGYEHL